jgi:copper chaperone
METVTLKIDGMKCGGCSGNVEKQLNAENGIGHVSASHTEKSAIVSFDPEVTSLANIIETIEDAGFDVLLIGDYGQVAS